jgi:hypothetical protein
MLSYAALRYLVQSLKLTQFQVTQFPGLLCCRRLCSGVLESWISSGLPCKIHVYLTIYVLSSDLRQNFQNITTA